MGNGCFITAYHHWQKVWRCQHPKWFVSHRDQVVLRARVHEVVMNEELFNLSDILENL